MPSQPSKIALVAAGVVIAVVAFLLLSPSEVEPPPPSGGEEVAPDGGADGGRADDRNGSGDDGGSRPAGPEVPMVDVRNGEPVGGVQEVEVESGETVEFRVESNTPDELHVHGYDLYEDVGPGQPARFSFPADLEGIFEVEMHDTGTLVAKLRVIP